MLVYALAKQEKEYTSIRKENDLIELNSQGSLNLIGFFFSLLSKLNECIHLNSSKRFPSRCSAA